MKIRWIIFLLTFACTLSMLPVQTSYAQEDDDLGILGGMGNLGGLGGLLGNLGGGLGNLNAGSLTGALGALGQMGNVPGLNQLGNLQKLAGAFAGQQAGPTVNVSQPAMLVVGEYLFIADNGKVVKLRLDNLQMVAQTQYDNTIAATSTAAPATSLRRPRKPGPVSSTVVSPQAQPAQPVPNVPLVPGAQPAPAP